MKDPGSTAEDLGDYDRRRATRQGVADRLPNERNARGLGGLSIAVRYVVIPAAPQMAALAGVALMIGFGLLIPIEALCDVPGIGQLTWIAAGKRDLPLLSALALLISTMVASVEWLGDLAR